MKRVKLTVTAKGNFLEIHRLEPIVRVDPYTDNIIEGDEKTDIPVEPDQLNRGYGFGSFILNLTPDEIEYDRKVVEFLRKAVNRKYSSLGDLFGFSLNDGNPQSNNDMFNQAYMTYASLGETLIVPQADCQIDTGIFRAMEQAAA